MKRIIIIGSSGSGKSTLANQLGATLDLPVIHLDKHFWHPGWVGTEPHVWQEKVRQFAAKESWIIDGNYRSTLHIRLETADTVVFLDLPRWLCTWRATKRRFQYWNRQRPDIAEGCQEKVFDPTFPRFIKWVWNYPNRARPNVLNAMKGLPTNKRFIWLKSHNEVKAFAENPRLWANQRAYLDGMADFFVTARFDG
jgi:adenylate kinase family enzyme